MSAQSEEMKEYVRSLVLLSHGRINSEYSVSQVVRPERSSSKINKNALTAPAGKPAKHVNTEQQTKKTRPEEIIPFDDDDVDFKDF